MDLPDRKRVRLKGYDYNTPGYYFVTICTAGKKKLLCDIVGTGLLDGPQVRFTAFGEIARKQLDTMGAFYTHIRIDKYVIMPNHVHLLLQVLGREKGTTGELDPANSEISKFVGTFKRFCNKAYGRNIWQARSHDHIIRGEKDYLKIWEYIENNPAKWAEDCFYVE